MIHTSPQPGSFRVGRGPRHTEALLLGALDELLPAGLKDLDLLAEPVVVVVPSNSLRDHLAARIVAHRGRPAIGLRLLTLFHLARDVVARSGGDSNASDAAFELMVRRRARAEPLLRDRLDPLLDGYAAVAGSVRDLLDAGLGEALLDGVLEHIDELARREGWHDTAALAAALVRVAADVSTGVRDLGIDPPGGLWAAAEEALARDPEGVLSARAVLVHGFADATGTATDLIRALVLRRGATVFLDDPPDPCDPEATDHGVAFSQRFRERIGMAPESVPEPGAAEPPQLDLFRAPGALAEARAAATRIRRLLDEGVPPESIVVAVRDLGPYALPLRTHLQRLAVPFSAGAASVAAGAAARRVAALVDLVELGPRTPTDRWLELVRADTDLRVGLRSLGLVTLQAVAELEVDRALLGDSLPLPVRRGFDSGDATEDAIEGDEEQPRAARALRRRLSRHALERAVARARRAVDRFAVWPGEAATEIHLAQVRALLADTLGQAGGEPGSDPALAACAGLATELPRGLRLARDEVAVLLRRAMAEVGRLPLGGLGGGVQLLSVVEARGRTAAHLFLLGLNRDLFPRSPSEDPLLPDAFRRALQVTLDAIPVKLEGHAEERYLFAQLVAAADHVTVSWQALDDDGRERTVSPLVQRLLHARGTAPDQVPLSPSALGAALDGGGPRPVLEHALAAGLAGDLAGFGRVLAAALPASVAGHRLATLAALEPAPAARLGARLGPFFGFVGARQPQADPRAQAPAVTTLEGVARCPWQAFLRNVLRLEPPRDPLERLAGLDPLLVGAALHDVLEAIAARAGATGGSLDEALARAPVSPAWPERDELAELIASCARRVAREHGAPALAPALAARLRPFLALVRELDWSPAAPAVLGVEVEGRVTVSGRALSFRADRVDAGAILTDYKTGRLVSEHKRETTRRDKLVEAVAAGERLQAVAYALASDGRGRYLFVRKPEEELDRAAREVVVDRDDAQVSTAFADAVSGLLRLWDAGGFVPRLLDHSRRRIGPACDSCDLRSACLQGDSAARRRLARWLDGAGDAPGADAEAAALGVLSKGGKR